jgi:hypothetical protein
MWNIEIFLYERDGCKLNKIRSPYMSRAADTLEKINGSLGKERPLV